MEVGIGDWNLVLRFGIGIRDQDWILMIRIEDWDFRLGLGIGHWDEGIGIIDSGMELGMEDFMLYYAIIL